MKFSYVKKKPHILSQIIPNMSLEFGENQSSHFFYDMVH